MDPGKEEKEENEEVLRALLGMFPDAGYEEPPPLTEEERIEKATERAQNIVTDRLVPSFEAFLLKQFVSYSVLILVKDFLVRVSDGTDTPVDEIKAAFINSWRDVMKEKDIDTRASSEAQQQMSEISSFYEIDPSELPDLSTFGEATLEEFCKTNLNRMLHIDV
jgi:hypothetical protein